MNPIYIHKGDCTIFADVKRFLTFNIQTDLDLTGWKVKFILGWITKEIEDISSKSFEIVLGADETKQLRLGAQCGSIILTDAEGHIKTVANNIPFEVTTAVVENEYQEIDLTIPESSGVDIKLKVGAQYVTSVNGMTGDVYLDIPSIEGLATKQELTPLATKQELQQGLNTKQDKGNYALVENVPTQVSELENDSNYATQTQVMQAIASIPQFSISLVDELPLAGEKMTLYLVSKGGESPDVYDEYIWIEQTSSFEFLGTTAVDLTEYVKNTDYSTSSTAGLVRCANTYGMTVIERGLINAVIVNLDTYKTRSTAFFVGKGTLDNVLTQYSKTQLITEDDYNALETKDANTLYLIEE